MSHVVKESRPKKHYAMISQAFLQILVCLPARLWRFGLVTVP